MRKHKTVTRARKPKVSKDQKPKLLLSERECLRVLGPLVEKHGGKRPPIAEIVEALDYAVKAPRVSQILKNLERLGLIEYRMEIVEGGAA